MPIVSEAELTETSAAANAIYHATRKRIRDLPIMLAPSRRGIAPAISLEPHKDFS